MIELSKNNMDFFNTSFYDSASSEYSKQRYNVHPQSFIHFFFQTRLRNIITLIKRNCSDRQDQLLIEDGCADGVVAQTVMNIYKESFSQGIGLDISPKMIEQARILNKNPRITFNIKKELGEQMKADVFLAVGFVSPGIFDDEFRFIRNHIKDDGLIIVSLASRNSPYAKLKLKDKEVTNDYWTFRQYEEFLKKDFEIVDSIPYGLFIPKLWAIPFIAMILQPLLEYILNLFPVLFHETLYVLKHKR